MKLKSIFVISILSALALLSVACGGGSASMKKITEKKVDDNLKVSISNSGGRLKNGEQEIMLSFKDGAGKPVEITAAALNFSMAAMGAMAEMNNAASLLTTAIPGEFIGKVNIGMTGEWVAQISYEGQQTGKTTMKLTAF